MIVNNLIVHALSIYLISLFFLHLIFTITTKPTLKCIPKSVNFSSIVFSNLWLKVSSQYSLYLVQIVLHFKIFVERPEVVSSVNCDNLSCLCSMLLILIPLISIFSLIVGTSTRVFPKIVFWFYNYLSFRRFENGITF